MDALRTAARTGTLAMLMAALAPSVFAQTKIRLHDAASEVAGCKESDAVPETTSAAAAQYGGSCVPSGLIETHVGADSAAVTQSFNRVEGPTVTLSESDAVATVRAMHVNITDTDVVEWLIESHNESDSAGTGHVICWPIELIETRVGGDSVAAIQSFGRTETLTVALSESDAAAAARAMRETMTETNAESDSAATVRVMHAAPIVTLSESDSAAYLTTRVQSKSITETLTCSPSAASVRCVPAGMIDTNVARDAVAASAQSFKVGNPIETLNCVPSLSAVHCASPMLIETHVGSDSLIGFKPAILRTLTESHATADYLSSGNTKSKNVIEVLATSDSLGATAARHANLLETMSPYDTLAVWHCGVLLEALTTSASVGIVKTISAGMTDTVNESDSVSWLAGRSLAETHVTSDVVSAGLPSTYSVNLNNALNVSDSIGISRSMHAAPTETLSLTDSPVGAYVGLKQLAESLTTSASLSAVAAHIVGISETVGALDQVGVQSLTEASVGVMEAHATFDAVTANRQLSASISETLSATDSMTVGRASSAAVAEYLGVSDSLSGSPVARPSAAFSETHITSDSISTTAPHAITVAITESLSYMDWIIYSSGGRRVVIIESQ